MTHMHVDPDDLTATGRSLDTQVSALQRIRAGVHAANVPSGAFGRIPGIGPHISDVYTTHVSDSTEVLQQATDGLDATIKSLQATANGLLEVERTTAHTISQSVPR